MERSLIEKLIAWKNKEDHLPILLRGARQVGKSYLIESFGKQYFDDVAIVDFERNSEFNFAFSTKNPGEILAKLEFILKKPIKSQSSLLFLDEIQLCPEALKSLRYFKEQMPALHIIAAGSLLEFLLKDENFSFPVGRIEFLYLHPLSFNEYLKAASSFISERLPHFDLNNPPNEIEHTEYLKWIRRYLFIGGMPSAISATLSEDSLLESQLVHSRLLQAYASDFGKYARHTQHKYLQLVFQKAPSLVSQVLKYKHIDEDARSRDIKPAIDLLCHAGLLQRVFATTAAGLPLHAHIKYDRLKLLYLDVGLLQTATKVDATQFFNKDILQINAGMIAEQFVGQELIAYASPHQNDPLLFWERVDRGQAEVDYVISIGSHIIPIEVKSGSTGSLRSLRSFLERTKSQIGIRISEHPLSLHNNILSIPLYLISSLEKITRGILSS